MKSYDLVAIGDITTDAFIRLRDASVHCDINKENCEICMSFASKIPYEFVEIIRAVGNAPNAAVSASRLGLKSALVAQIGDDENGKECVEVLKNEKVDTEYITVHDNHNTNYHYVLWYEDERTILVRHEDFKYKLPEISSAKWIYLTSLGSAAENLHDDISNFLASRPDVKLAFQPGTFQIKMGTARLEKIYRQTEIFFCNIEEAQTILNIKDHIDKRAMLEKMYSLGPKLVVLTDGINGSYTYDGKEALHMPIYPDPKPPYERTGAGDAFSSTFVAAIILGKSPAEALAWGGINAMWVVQEVGAQRGLLTRTKLEEYLKNAPESYKAVKLS